MGLCIRRPRALLFYKCSPPPRHCLRYKRGVNRTRREDWLEQGFEVLREGGEAALTIDRLCKDLGRTKGAFYHHFADVTVYTDALLAAWEDRNSALASLSAEAATGARRGARGVIEAAVRGFDVSLERSFRAWGLRDPRAHAFVARIDERRIAFLSGRYAATVPAATRRKLARLEYAVFVGVQQLYPEISAQVARELERALELALHSVSGAGALRGPGGEAPAVRVAAAASASGKEAVIEQRRAGARKHANGHRGKQRFLRG